MTPAEVLATLRDHGLTLAAKGKKHRRASLLHGDR